MLRCDAKLPDQCIPLGSATRGSPWGRHLNPGLYGLSTDKPDSGEAPMARRPSVSFESPQILLETAKSEMAAIPQEKLFNSSEYEKAREKWCAAMFGLGYAKCVRPCRVAVNASDQRKDVDLWLE